jgi:multidrug efflux system membrane fusion protein
MNIVTEPNISGRAISDKPRARPVRMVRWFIIVGLLLALLVGTLVVLHAFHKPLIA